MHAAIQSAAKRHDLIEVSPQIQWLFYKGVLVSDRRALNESLLANPYWRIAAGATQIARSQDKTVEGKAPRSVNYPP